MVSVERGDRLHAHRRGLLGRIEQVEFAHDDALPQRPGGDAHHTDVEDREGRLGDDRAGEHLTGAGLGDPRQGRPLLRGARGQGVDDAFEIAAEEFARGIDPVSARGRTGDARQGPEGLRGADYLVGGPDPVDLAGDATDLRSSVLAQAVDVLGRGDRVGQEVRVGAAGAEWDRDRRLRIFVLAGRDLERTAADVEQQDLAGGPAEPAWGG